MLKTDMHLRAFEMVCFQNYEWLLEEVDFDDVQAIERIASSFFPHELKFVERYWPGSDEVPFEELDKIDQKHSGVSFFTNDEESNREFLIRAKAVLSAAVERRGLK